MLGTLKWKSPILFMFMQHFETIKFLLIQYFYVFSGHLLVGRVSLLCPRVLLYVVEVAVSGEEAHFAVDGGDDAAARKREGGGDVGHGRDLPRVRQGVLKGTGKQMKLRAKQAKSQRPVVKFAEGAQRKGKRSAIQIAGVTRLQTIYHLKTCLILP